MASRSFTWLLALAVAALWVRAFVMLYRAFT